MAKEWLSNEIEKCLANGISAFIDFSLVYNYYDDLAGLILTPSGLRQGTAT